MEKLKTVYKLKENRIKERLNDFKKFYNEPVSWFYENNQLVLKPIEKSFNERIFEELVFCLLTANTSAVMGLKGVDAVRPVINDSFDQIRNKLVASGYRFPNKRAEYIIESRNKNFDYKTILESKNKIELREFFVNNVKGLGYKESSHFLRNIGVFGLAILDKHILRTMHEHNIIDEIPTSLNKNKYLELEQSIIQFSHQLNINMDELDLLLWSMKNGRILK